MDWWNNLGPTHRIVFTLMVAFGVISFWRGIWGLWDYVFPNNYLISLLLSIFIGLEILLITHHLADTWK